MPLGNYQQREIVVPEHSDSAVSEALNEAQHCKRLGTAVHEIAYEPQRVAGWIERDAREQPHQLIVAALYVAYGIGCHVPSVMPQPRKQKRRSMLRLI
jgi:hypothetical protein